MVGNKDHEEINPSGIRISVSGILDGDCVNQEINDNARSDQKFYIEDSENPLAQFQTPSAETKPPHHHRNANIKWTGRRHCNCTWGNQESLWILQDDYCEEMAYPHLFPTDKFGYKVKRKFHLTHSKYFNQRLLHYSQQFSSDTAIYFSHMLLSKKFI